MPNQIKLPGTQPEDNIVSLDEVSACANCHGNYDQNVEPLHNWQGSMMSHAGRDPIFWATVAIAEQDFDGSGDLCIRCHNAAGWLDGRSTPTDGSGLDETVDRNGVQCDHCHRLTNPDDSEHLGEQNDPFVANDADEGGNPVEGNYGSGEYVVTFSNTTKLGPYADANPPPAAHSALQSQFHRSPELCGTCHDVSNPVTGDLAHNNGAQVDLNYNGGLDSPLDAKVAFNYRPFQYGVVERTYSEHKASRLGDTLVSDYPNLPADLQTGALKRAYDAAIASNPSGNGDYVDGAPRYFSCQTCHMPPVRGKGASRPGGRFAPPVRDDLPKHDLTGGNYWMPEAMQWLDARGRLKFGGLTAAENTAMDAGALRARSNLDVAASLSVTGNTIKVINTTTHKLISGYPEGRRMWLNIQWYDASGVLIAEDGAYGNLATQMDLDGDGSNDNVRTLLDLHDHNTRLYEVHGSFTQDWASTLIAVNSSKYSDLVIGFDRVTGQPTATVTDVAAQAPGTSMQSFHFVLNNHVLTDTRIPGYGYSFDEAKRRNALPVPANQYGNPGPGGEYNYWDELTMNVPVEAATATIRLMYQPTSWEYVQFLYLANETQNPTLSTTGKDFLDAWLATGMAEPHVMATTTWTNTGVNNNLPVADFTVECVDLSCAFDGSPSSDSDGNIVKYDWAFGDGNTATGQSPNYVYAANGVYTVSLIVTDDDGATDMTQMEVSVGSAANQIPTASFTFQCTELACDFDGSSSNDANGSIVSYAWDFGDNTSATGANVSHTYAAGGSYSVTLTVTDDAGASGSSTQTVSVTIATNPAPTASYTYQCENLVCTFNGSSSTDDSKIVSYTWDFGDGSVPVTLKEPIHSYDFGTDGTYDVTLTVTDDGGATGSVTQTISVVGAVINQAPTASFTFQCTDLACSFDGSNSDDIDGAIVSYAWNFGDGNTATTAGSSVSHTYIADGTYTVSLTVTDDAGATGSISQQVSVVAPANLVPTASFTFQCANLACSFDGSASSDLDGAIVSYAWNFGDDATATTVNVGHTYAVAGTYTVSLTVTDDANATNTATQNVTATSIPGPGPGPRGGRRR
ncbi:MAG: PKD domain-containing protein [Pseudomonadota bacterium]